MSSAELKRLTRRVAELERENARLRASVDAPEGFWESDHGLSASQVERYARHLVLPSFGPKGQQRLLRGSVLVVGAGGLGSAALLYLAGAGVGTIGVVDRDTVALSNLHRQVLYSEGCVGESKTAAAKTACEQRNSSVAVKTYSEGIGPGNAVEIVEGFDVVIDATDNAPTRYLVSDACVVTGKPLVSGAAVGTDGQLTVYNHGPEGPCYRCLFPKPPSADACASCAEAGVLGPVPGAVGVLQAMEAIKVLAETGEVLARRLLILDFLRAEFRTVRLRPRARDCVACGQAPSLTRSGLAEYDYPSFAGQDFCEGPGGLSRNFLAPSERLSPAELQTRLRNRRAEPFVLLDVRPKPEFEVCRLRGEASVCAIALPARLPAGSTPLPFDRFGKLSPAAIRQILGEGGRGEEGDGPEKKAVVVVCRRGNDSQIAVTGLKEQGVRGVADLRGGLDAWRDQIEPSFPKY